MHTRHIRCVEVCEVERGESVAQSEHTLHRRHLLGVKILDAFYIGQFSAVIEPIITNRGSCIGKRSIKDHLFDILSLRFPSRMFPFLHIKVISSFGGSAVFECKRSCAFVKHGITLIYKAGIVNLLSGICVAEVFVAYITLPVFLNFIFSLMVSECMLL